MIRAVIDDVVTSYSKRIHSHKSSWPRMQRCLVQDYFDTTAEGGACMNLWSDAGGAIPRADTWLVSHSMEFGGDVYNLFGGLSDDVLERVQRLIDFEGKVFSLERRMPDLGVILGVRGKEQKYWPLWQELSENCRRVPTLSHREILEWVKPIEHVVLGDSHAIAHYQSGALVSRTDGLTLHRLLETGLYSSLCQVVDHPIKMLTVCAGNIDIRHHLLRREDWKKAVDNLVLSLRIQVGWLIENCWIEECEVVAPLPIECAERRIPKTGWYRGTPFYGDVMDRDNVRWYMDQKLIERPDIFNVFHWSTEWYRDPYWYADERMEKPGSVHLSPAYHRWNYDDNVANNQLIEEYK